MPAQRDIANLSVRQFAERLRPEMVPLNSCFSYASAPVPLSEEDLREYLQEPIAALPPSMASLLPKIEILLVPYLGPPPNNGTSPAASSKDKRAEQLQPTVQLEKPADHAAAWTMQWLSSEHVVLAFAMQDQEVADYHYHFYRLLATLLAERLSSDALSQYAGLLREELTAQVHGEVDEESWRAKQGLLRRQKGVKRDTKAFIDYARHSLIDTLTLYLHGICCDIDVDTGPRQVPSRYLRKRLKLIQSLYPPPSGYSVFPEDATQQQQRA